MNSVVGLLGVLFVALKLLGYISWSWLWVLVPFWIPLTLVIIVWSIACYKVWRKCKDGRC